MEGLRRAGKAELPLTALRDGESGILTSIGGGEKVEVSKRVSWK